MLARNSHVAQQLQVTYGGTVPGGNLQVFCISNKDYWEHRTEPSDQALPFLTLSGIIEVRKYCVGLVANSQLRTATAFMRDDIPALLADVELWVQSGAGSISAERQEAIQVALGALEARLGRVAGPR